MSRWRGLKGEENQLVGSKQREKPNEEGEEIVEGRRSGREWGTLLPFLHSSFEPQTPG
jgi:hypothetical protein